jgi:hypothetical protein
MWQRTYAAIMLVAIGWTIWGLYHWETWAIVEASVVMAVVAVEDHRRKRKSTRTL